MYKMTKEEVIEMAKAIAIQEDWMWFEPVNARLRRSWFSRERVWEVTSNWGIKGCNVCVEVDDETGEVKRKVFFPR